MPTANPAALAGRRAARAGSRAGARAGPNSRVQASPRGHAGRARAAAPQVRWDRLARVAMLGVLVALLYLYLSAGVHLLSTWRQARRNDATVQTLQREHERLAQQRAVLVKPETVELEARRLGMIKAGEQGYVVSGLPGG